ncbi:MAG: hypothetical protein HQL29_06335 [Candidatus Omnitrophica bacterium]|nr:hypothetical protein [Candidatus Omnitrophota bacterium]
MKNNSWLKHTLVDLFDNFPQAFSSPEIMLSIKNSHKLEVAHKIGAKMKKFFHNDLKPFSPPTEMEKGEYLIQSKDDGYVTVAGHKIQLKDGRSALVRWSNTSEKLTTIFEGPDNAGLISIMSDILTMLDQEATKENSLDTSNLIDAIKTLKGEPVEKKSSSSSASKPIEDGRPEPKSDLEKLLRKASGDDVDIQKAKQAYDKVFEIPVSELYDHFESNLNEIQKTLSEDLFGYGNGYDIRGNALPSTDGTVGLTPETTYLIGKLLATYYTNIGDKVLITGDMRLHTPIIKYMLALGASKTGVNVDFSPDAITTGAHNLLFTENPGNYKFMVQVSGSHGAYHKNGLKIKVNFNNETDHKNRFILKPLYAGHLEDLYKKRKELRNDLPGKLTPIADGLITKNVVKIMAKTLPPYQQ